MAWSQLEPTGPHVTYLVLTFFLILYALFSLMIRNRLHLSEPPLATLFGIVSVAQAQAIHEHFLTATNTDCRTTCPRPIEAL